MILGPVVNSRDGSGTNVVSVEYAARVSDAVMVG